MPSGFSSGTRSLGTSERHRFEEAEIPRRERPAPEYTSKKLSAERKITELLALADIQINGPRPWDIQVNDRGFYERVLAQGSLGAGEAYMDGWWEVEALDQFFDRLRRFGVENEVRRWSVAWLALRSKLFNLQSRSRAAEVAHTHYDLGNDLYEAMLDRRMQYTCAYWKDAATLEKAQENKLDLICRKLKLQPGMTILELGGGFGGFAQFAAAQYGCSVVSYNISAEQVAYAREWCKGLPVRIELKDYREAIDEEGQFDRVASIGLCEHVGYKNYRSFLELAHAKLKERGLFLLHTIGEMQSQTSTDPWIDKYIFPNGVIPSVAQLGQAMEDLWVMEDWHNFGPDYDRTLVAWWDKFNRGWPRLASKYGERFRRMWKYYLMASAGAFRARHLQLWQIVLSKGHIDSYTPVR
jgi:cyclopropane-fatty-acyl-phospholipid synthase